MQHVLRYLVSGVLIALLISWVDFGEVTDALRSAHAGWMILGLAMALPGILVSVWKWRLLLARVDITHASFFSLWRLYHIGGFFSNFLPTEMGGDVVRSYEVGRKGGRIPEALAAAFMERLTGLGAVLVFGVLGTGFSWRLAREMGLAPVMLGLSAAFVIGVAAVTSSRGSSLTGRWLTSIPRLQGLGKKVSTFHRAMVRFREARTMVAAMILSLVNQFIGILANGFYALALGASIPLMDLTLVVSAIILIGVVPVTINGYGLREATIVLLFGALGMGEGEALALAVISRVGLLLPALVGGALYSLGPDRGLDRPRDPHSPSEAPTSPTPPLERGAGN